MTLWCVPDDFKGVGKADYITGDGRSPTLERLSQETGKEYRLEVDYARVLDIVYYGTSLPPERAYDDQIHDWLSGYMWGRFEVDELCQKKEGGGHFYWVKYPAVLSELEEFPAEVTWEFDMLPLVPNAFQNLYARMMEFQVAIGNKIGLYGFEVVDSSIDIEKKKFYLTTREVASPHPAVIVVLILAVAAAFSICFWKWTSYKEQKVILERQVGLQDAYDTYYQQFLDAGDDPDTAYAKTIEILKLLKTAQDKDKMDWEKYLMYGVLAIVGIIAVKYLVIPMLHRGD